MCGGWAGTAAWTGGRRKKAGTELLTGRIFQPIIHACAPLARGRRHWHTVHPLLRYPREVTQVISSHIPSVIVGDRGELYLKKVVLP